MRVIHVWRRLEGAALRCSKNASPEAREKIHQESACSPANGLCASVLSMMMAKDSTYAASALLKRPGLSLQ
jgi:hypothetical protein